VLSPLAAQWIQLNFTLVLSVHLSTRASLPALAPHTACLPVHWFESFWFPVAIAVAVPAALQETVLVFALCARKHSQAPFFPPVKWISPPKTSDIGAGLGLGLRIGLAETETSPPVKMEIAVFEEAVLRASLADVQCIHLTFATTEPPACVFQTSAIGLTDQSFCTAVHWFESFWPVEIVDTFPAAAHEGTLAALVLALKHNQAPLVPPEKSIFPRGTRDVGLAVTATSRLVLDNATNGAFSTFTGELPASLLEAQ
jgi:hypothetical protein